MISQIAYNWTLVATVTICLIVGLIVVSTVCYGYSRTFTIALGSLAFAALGFALMTTPKWTEVVIEVGDFKTRIGQMQKQVTGLKVENQTLAAQSNNLKTQLASFVQEKQTLVAQSSNLKNQLAKLAQENQTLAARSTNLTSQLATKTNDLVTAQKTVTSLTAERDQAQAAAKTAVEELKGVAAKIGNVVPFDAKQQLDSAIEILQ